MVKTWTDDELATLDRLYATAPRAEILAALPGRGWNAIKLRAFARKIKRAHAAVVEARREGGIRSGRIRGSLAAVEPLPSWWCDAFSPRIDEDRYRRAFEGARFTDAATTDRDGTRIKGNTAHLIASGSGNGAVACVEAASLRRDGVRRVTAPRAA